MSPTPRSRKDQLPTAATSRTRSGTVRRIAGAALVVAAVIAVPTLGPISAAEAAVSGYSATVQYIGGGSYINVRRAPSTSSAVVRRLAPGSGLLIDCQVVGGRLGSSTYADNRTWDRLSDGTYVHDVLTTTPGGPRTPLTDGGYAAFSPLPRCGDATSSRESKAVAWATGQIGSTAYAGLCETMVERAFGTVGRYGSAEADYQAERAAGRIHTDTAAPAGSLVFYDYGGPTGSGHVSLSIGSGQTISTFGTEGSGRRIAQVALTARGLTYKGWAYAPDSWSGRP